MESLEAGSVIFECKAGPFVPHEVEGIHDLKSELQMGTVPNVQFLPDSK